MVKAKQIDGKKFMWDGLNFGNEAEAKVKEKAYKDEGFETRVTMESGKYVIYTRRLVTEVVVEGAPI